MSGPKTLVIGADPFAVLLSAAAIRAAWAIQEGEQRAAALQDAHRTEAQARGDQRADAARTEFNVLHTSIHAAETRAEQLQMLAATLSSSEAVQRSRPTHPSSSDTVALTGYLDGLRSWIAEVEGILLTEAARTRDDSGAVSHELALPEGPKRDSLAQRLVSRIAHLGPLPTDIETLANELEQTPPGERLQLLATELRRRIQLFAEARRARQLEEATAIIVEQSLKDLGYQVDDIPETLFVEGGVAHFRRPDWGDYMVRMRVEGGVHAANFNVVSASDAPDGEVPVADHLAEDRWCAEFPALLHALEARGARIQVTRKLAPGELPVQRVGRDKLPHFADRDTEAESVPLRAKERE